MNKKRRIAVLMVRRQAQELAALYCKPCEVKREAQAILKESIYDVSQKEISQLVGSLEYPDPSKPRGT